MVSGRNERSMRTPSMVGDMPTARSTCDAIWLSSDWTAVVLPLPRRPITRETLLARIRRGLNRWILILTIVGRP